MAKVRQCLGIDIGTHSLRIADLAISAKKVEIRGLVEARLEIDPGMTEIQRQAAISAQINTLLKNAKIKTKNAVFCISGQTAFVRQLKVPSTTPERLQRIIQFEAKEQIPFPLEQTAFEYQVFPTDSANELEVLLVAIRKDHIDGFMRLVKRTALNPLAISVSSLAVHNFYEVNSGPKDLIGRMDKKKADGAQKKTAKKKKGAAEDEPTAGPEAGETGMEFEEIQAEVNLGATMMDLAIPKAGGRRLIGFTRTVPVAGGHMDRAIRQKLNLPSMEEARRIKEQEAAILSSEFELSGDAGEVNMAASQAATVVANSIVAEIRRSLDFFISQPDGVAVDSIVLSGGLSRMKYLDSYIEEKMGIPVELARVKNESLDAGEFADQLPNYVIPVGLALQGLGIGQLAIDFLPQDIKNVRAFTENKIPLAISAATLALTILISFNAGEKYIAQHASFADSAERVIVDARRLSENLKQAKAENALVAGKYAEIGRLVGPRDYLLKFSAAVLQARPSEVLLERINEPNTGYFEIGGMVQQRNSVIQFWEDLKKDTIFVQEAKLVSLVPVPPIPPPPIDNALRFTISIKTGARNGRFEPIKKPAEGSSGAGTGPARPGAKPAAGGNRFAR